MDPNSFTSWIVQAVDYPLGWLLRLPRDLTLLFFAAGTALLMTLARRAVTDQDLLQRCGLDLQRLKQRIREAKQVRDQPQLQRLRSTVGLIKGMQLVADMRVLAVVLIPVAALAIWAAERLDYLPPRIGQDLIVSAHFPLSSVDSLTHLVPADGFELKSPAIQVIPSAAQASPDCVAEWTVRPTADATDLSLIIRHRRESATHHLSVGQTTYRPPLQTHPHERLTTTEVSISRYRPLGWNLPGESMLPPWMLGYLVLTMLLVPAFKRLLRVF